LYATSYAKLIGAIKAKSPDTVIILQTVYPVGASPEGFSKDGVTLNGYIDTLNEWLLDIAKQNGVYVVDTASALKDADGLLASAYDTGDGIHLTVAAYDVILQYLRTHGVQ
jgi:lysophospholipase L1-like esterase